MTGALPRPVRNHFDQLGKQIGKEALGSCGSTVAQYEISPETQYADLCYEPDPEHQAERMRLGLLGQMASVPCLIEIYARAPTAEDFRACLSKHLAYWRQRARKHEKEAEEAKRLGNPAEAFVEPYLLIVAAGSPTGLRSKLRLVRARAWPTGVYFFRDDVLRVGLVVASELPRRRFTLLVRLMAAGPLLRQAIEDLAALPPDAHEHAVADQILLNCRRVIGQEPSQTPEEQEFIVIMQNTWEQARDEGRKEGRKEGLAEEAARSVLTVLRVRGIEVPDAVRKRILAEKDRGRLERWHERAILASSIVDVLDEPS